jgi:hypothetical protein
MTPTNPRNQPRKNPFFLFTVLQDPHLPQLQQSQGQPLYDLSVSNNALSEAEVPALAGVLAVAAILIAAGV